MYKLLVLLVPLLVMPMAVPVYADAPPAHGGYEAGWGLNPTNWQTASGSFSAWGLYAPDSGSAGDPWVVNWSDPHNVGFIDYADITLELWIEMYALQTYHYTSYQWHRLGNSAEQICFIIEGLIQSNNGQSIILVHQSEPMTHLYFRHDVLNRTGSQYGSDIPITWQTRYGLYDVYGSNIVQNWTTATPDPDIIISIPKCDHWFQFQGCFDLEYHVDDGYYSLTLAGCPAPGM
jgi:hypothetical protein